jgi:hypothetical protein
VSSVIASLRYPSPKSAHVYRSVLLVHIRKQIWFSSNVVTSPWIPAWRSNTSSTSHLIPQYTVCFFISSLLQCGNTHRDCCDRSVGNTAMESVLIGASINPGPRLAHTMDHTSAIASHLLYCADTYRDSYTRSTSDFAMEKLTIRDS